MRKTKTSSRDMLIHKDYFLVREEQLAPAKRSSIAVLPKK